MHSTDLSQHPERPTNSQPQTHSPPINSLTQTHQTKRNPYKYFDEIQENIDVFHHDEPLVNHEDKTSIRNKPLFTIYQTNTSSPTANDVNTEPMDKKNASSSPSPTAHPPQSKLNVDPVNVGLGIFH
jgi:hypothetical protein